MMKSDKWTWFPTPVVSLALVMTILVMPSTVDGIHYCLEPNHDSARFAIDAPVDVQKELVSMVAVLELPNQGDRLIQVANTLRAHSIIAEVVCDQVRSANTTGIAIDFTSSDWFGGPKGMHSNAWFHTYRTLVRAEVHTHYQHITQSQQQSVIQSAARGLVETYCGVIRYRTAIQKKVDTSSKFHFSVLYNRYYRTAYIQSFLGLLIRLLMFSPQSTTNDLVQHYSADSITAFLRQVGLWQVFCIDDQQRPLLDCETILGNEFGKRQQGTGSLVFPIEEIPIWFQAGEGVLLAPFVRDDLHGSDPVAALVQNDFRDLMLNNKQLSDGEQQMLAFRYRALLIVLLGEIEYKMIGIYNKAQLGSTTTTDSSNDNTNGVTKCKCPLKQLGVGGVVVGGSGIALYQAYPSLVELWRRIFGGTSHTTPLPVQFTEGVERDDIGHDHEEEEHEDPNNNNSNSDSDSDSPVPIIIGVIVIVLLVSLVIAAIAYYFYFNGRPQQQVGAPRQGTGLQGVVVLKDAGEPSKVNKAGKRNYNSSASASSNSPSKSKTREVNGSKFGY